MVRIFRVNTARIYLYDVQCKHRALLTDAKQSEQRPIASMVYLYSVQ